VETKVNAPVAANIDHLVLLKDALRSQRPNLRRRLHNLGRTPRPAMVSESRTTARVVNAQVVNAKVVNAKVVNAVDVHSKNPL